jgi:hypothetical protein
MICPSCGAWITEVIVYENSWVRYDLSIDSYGEPSWDNQETVEDVGTIEIQCPECNKPISKNSDEIIKKLKFCMEKKYRKQCQTCEDKFKCWTT